MDDGVNAYFGVGRSDATAMPRGGVTGNARGPYHAGASQDVDELVQKASQSLSIAEKQLEYVEAEEDDQMRHLAQAEKRLNAANKTVHELFNRLQDARREAHAASDVLESLKDALARTDLRKIEARRERDRCAFIMDNTMKMGGGATTQPKPSAPSVPQEPTHNPYGTRPHSYHANSHHMYKNNPGQTPIQFVDTQDERSHFGNTAHRRNMSSSLASRLASARSKAAAHEDTRGGYVHPPKAAQEYEHGSMSNRPPPSVPGFGAQDDLYAEPKDSARSKLEHTMEPFMPRAHHLKGHLSMLPGIQEKVPRSGSICNRTCNFSCLSQSARGFLAMADIEIMNENCTVDTIVTALTKARRKYHPDKNRIEVVGAEEFHHAEEMCKIASSLVNLFKEADNINIVVHLQPQDLKLKFQMHMKDTIESIKQRIEEEESLSKGSLTVALGQHPLGDHLTLSQCGIMEMAVLTVTSNNTSREGRRVQF